MSVLKSKRGKSKAEFVNVASQIYTETLHFLSRLFGFSCEQIENFRQREALYEIHHIPTVPA